MKSPNGGYEDSSDETTQLGDGMPMRSHFQTNGTFCDITMLLFAIIFDTIGN